MKKHVHFRELPFGISPTSSRASCTSVCKEVVCKCKACEASSGELCVFCSLVRPSLPQPTSSHEFSFEKSSDKLAKRNLAKWNLSAWFWEGSTSRCIFYSHYNMLKCTRYAFVIDHVILPLKSHLLSLHSNRSGWKACAVSVLLVLSIIQAPLALASDGLLLHSKLPSSSWNS